MSSLPPKQVSNQTSYDLTNQIQAVNNILINDPKNVDQLTIRANSYYLLNQYEQSLRDCKLILQLQPMNTKIKFLMACCYENLSDPAQTVQLCKQILQTNPDNQAAVFKLAILENNAAVVDQIIEMSQSQEQSFQSSNSRESNFSALSYYRYQPVSEKVFNTVSQMLKQSGDEDADDELFTPVDQLVGQYMAVYSGERAPGGNAQFQRAVQARRRGDYKDAVAILNDLLAQKPADSQARQQYLFNRAYCYEQLQDYQRALADYLDFLVGDPHNVQCLFNLSCVYLKVGDYSKAGAYVDKALDLIQKSAVQPQPMVKSAVSAQSFQPEEFYFQKALILKQEQKYAESIAQVERALRTDPDNPKYLQLHAYCCSQVNDLQNLQNCLRDYNKLVDIFTSDGSAQLQENLFNRGVIYLKLNRLQESTDDFRRAHELQSDNQTTIKALISNLLLQENFAEAARFAELLDEGDRSFNAIQYKANIYKQLRQYDYAYKLYQQIDDYQNMGYCMRKLNRFQQAVECYNKLENLSSKDLSNRAFCYARLMQYQEAIRDYTDVIALEKDNSSYYLNRGLCYQKIRQLDKSRQDIRRCLDLEPDNRQARLVLEGM